MVWIILGKEAVNYLCAFDICTRADIICGNHRNYEETYKHFLCKYYKIIHAHAHQN